MASWFDFFDRPSEPEPRASPPPPPIPSESAPIQRSFSHTSSRTVLGRMSCRSVDVDDGSRPTDPPKLSYRLPPPAQRVRPTLSHVPRTQSARRPHRSRSQSSARETRGRMSAPPGDAEGRSRRTGPPQPSYRLPRPASRSLSPCGSFGSVLSTSSNRSRAPSAPRLSREISCRSSSPPPLSYRVPRQPTRSLSPLESFSKSFSSMRSTGSGRTRDQGPSWGVSRHSSSPGPRRRPDNRSLSPCGSVSSIESYRSCLNAPRYSREISRNSSSPDPRRRIPRPDSRSLSPCGSVSSQALSYSREGSATDVSSRRSSGSRRSRSQSGFGPAVEVNATRGRR